jgi:hypothetical protein
MTSLNNLEKLIQMATIEHMYSMLNKMKNDSVFNLDNNNSAVDISLNSSVMSSLENDNKCLQNTIKTLITRISFLENEIKDLKNNTENSANKYEYLCAQLRGQQKLTSYPGFSKQDPMITRTDTSPHIILKIEEKNIDNENNTFTELETELFNYDTKDDVIESEDEESEEEQVEEEEQEEPEEEEQVEEEQVEEQVEEEQVEEEKEEQEKEEQEVEEQEKEEQVEEEEEEESEEELHTDVEEEKEEEEEEEEVFEIEIDDITYFATDEENGILYAMTKDGDVGEKVGIIKEGEPIFS